MRVISRIFRFTLQGTFYSECKFNAFYCQLNEMSLEAEIHPERDKTPAALKCIWHKKRSGQGKGPRHFNHNMVLLCASPFNLQIPKQTYSWKRFDPWRKTKRAKRII